MEIGPTEGTNQVTASRDIWRKWNKEIIMLGKLMGNKMIKKVLQDSRFYL